MQCLSGGKLHDALGKYSPPDSVQILGSSVCFGLQKLRLGRLVQGLQRFANKAPLGSYMRQTVRFNR